MVQDNNHKTLQERLAEQFQNNVQLYDVTAQKIQTGQIKGGEAIIELLTVLNIQQITTNMMLLNLNRDSGDLITLTEMKL